MSAMYYVIVPVLILLGLAQSALVPYFRVFGVTPDLMMVVVVSWSLLRGWKAGLIWALIGGLVLDLLSALPFGTITLGMVLASVSAGIIIANVYHPSLPVVLLAIAISTMGYYLVLMVGMALSGWSVAWMDTLSQVVLPVAGVNAGLAIVVLAAMRWLYGLIGREELRR